LTEVVVPAAAPAPFAYTADQRKAIEFIEGNLQIIACAGSGKTQVISERVAYLLEREHAAGLRPANIVAFTFTDRAAASLKDRIAQRIRSRLGDIPGLAEMYVGTIHGFCLNLLQQRVPKYFKYQVLTDVQTRLFVDRHSQQSGMGSVGCRRFIDSRRYIEAMNILREGHIRWDLLQGHPVVPALQMYRDLLDKKAYLDYTSIMEAAVDLVEGDAQVRDELKATIRYLIVDEYQDVNPLQERLVRALRGLGASVCVVGDDDQTLYQFRGTDIENILRFDQRYAPVQTIRMQDNFRSSPGIVDLARNVIRENVNRLPKEMESGGHQAFERGDILCQRFDDPAAEAAWIAGQIGAMVGQPFLDEVSAEPRGLAYSDFAVLFRSVRGNAAPVLAALQAAGIPAVVIGFNNLFERPEIRAARALFGYMVGEVTESELADAWRASHLGYTGTQWEAAVAALRDRRSFPATARRVLYTLQRTYLNFLATLELREERIPSADAEVIFYNLGKFSQVISDYEQIHFHSDPREKHSGFYQFLVHQAGEYYPEGAQENALARPNAVQVMTVHQAKGLEWPVVFVPALLKNRFPAKAPGGKSVWHLLPAAAVANAADYKGGLEQERRVLYVALTRAQRYLFASFAPMSGNQLFRLPSQFVGEITRTHLVLTRPAPRELATPLPPQSKRAVVNLPLTFSQFKYYQECPYQFKLRFLYGFNAPIEEALGYGKSLHDALAEIHQRSLAGAIPDAADLAGIVTRHLNVPFAYRELRETLLASGIKAIAKYYEENRPNLDHLQHVEQVVELDLGDGVIVNGRIDLIRNLESGETAIVDFKSNERAQEEDVTRVQLHIYTIGYRALTGESADLIEVHELEKGRVLVREEVSQALEDSTVAEIRAAAAALRANHLPKLAAWSKPCATCDFSGICRDSADA
jgi:DNA helicase II / ATP-dependent DNA helicase PcrA